MPRFYVDPSEIQKDIVTLNAEDSRHAVSVMRIQPGAVVDLIDGKGTSLRGVVAGIRGGRVEITVDKSSRVEFFQSLEITLAAAVIKSERMDFLIQKSCELGVSAIIPVLAERSVVKLAKERGESKVKRWQKIAHESCKQCGLSKTPVIEEPRNIKELLKGAGRFDLILIPTLCKETVPLSHALKTKHAKKLLIFIGPEGDFTPKETESAVTAGAIPVSLGPLVLRSETAALYALSAVHFFYREIDKPSL